MKITIRNKIKIDQQEELIKESYNGNIKQNAEKIMLMYENVAKEKVLIKFDQKELTMTRFADKAVSMHFNPEKSSTTPYEGLGNLTILTEKLIFNPEQHNIKISYQLIQHNQKIGDYKLRIDWSDE